MEHRREPRVDGRLQLVIFRRLLDRLIAVKRREIRILTVAERDEPELLQVFLAGIGDNHLGRAFCSHSRAVGAVGMNGKARDQAAVVQANAIPAPLDLPLLDAPDVGQPPRACVGADQDRAEGVCGVPPQITIAGGPCHVLPESRSRPGRARRAMRKPHQDPRKCQSDEPRILRLPQRPPFRIFGLVERPRQLQRPFQFVEAVQSEE